MVTERKLARYLERADFFDYVCPHGSISIARSFLARAIESGLECDQLSLGAGLVEISTGLRPYLQRLRFLNCWNYASQEMEPNPNGVGLQFPAFYILGPSGMYVTDVDVISGPVRVDRQMTKRA